MAKKTVSKKPKIGDKIVTFIIRRPNTKIKTYGYVKEIKEEFGGHTYTITKASTEDFTTRKVQLSK